MQHTVKQQAKITKQGPQLIINIQKKFFDELKEYMHKDLKMTITFNDKLD